jgi:hypothetical protein
LVHTALLGMLIALPLASPCVAEAPRDFVDIGFAAMPRP